MPSKVDADAIDDFMGQSNNSQETGETNAKSNLTYDTMGKKYIPSNQDKPRQKKYTMINMQLI